MSAYWAVVVACDVCGREERFEDDNTLRSARKYLREEKCWLTGIKPTKKHPSMYSGRADICPHCVDA